MVSGAFVAPSATVAESTPSQVDKVAPAAEPTSEMTTLIVEVDDRVDPVRLGAILDVVASHAGEVLIEYLSILCGMI